MSLAPAEQDDLYTRFWNPIEEFTKYDPSSFVRDYLTMKQGKIGRIDKIYFIFKEYAETANINRATLLEDMYHYAKIYSQVDNAKVGTDKLNRKLNQLRTLDSTIAYPFFMAFFDYASQVGLAETEIYQVLDVIEAYWARRIICNLPSNALNKVFATLHRDVLNHVNKTSDDTAPSYIAVLTYVLLKKGRSSVFPSDEEVKGDFKTRQVYKMPANARMFILERMENQDNNERHDVVKELTERISRLSILCHRPYRTSGKLPWVKIGKEFMSNICTQWQISRSLDIILNTATLPLLRKETWRRGSRIVHSA